jgi:hypothetical protein
MWSPDAFAEYLIVSPPDLRDVLPTRYTTP